MVREQRGPDARHGAADCDDGGSPLVSYARDSAKPPSSGVRRRQVPTPRCRRTWIHTVPLSSLVTKGRAMKHDAATLIQHLSSLCVSLPSTRRIRKGDKDVFPPTVGTLSCGDGSVHRGVIRLTAR